MMGDVITVYGSVLINITVDGTIMHFHDTADPSGEGDGIKCF